MDLKRAREKIKVILDDAGLVPTFIEISCTTVQDCIPENQGSNLEFLDFKVQAIDVNGVPHDITHISKIRLVDGTETSADGKQRGFCLACNAPIGLINQRRCSECQGLFCKEHCRDRHPEDEKDEGYYCGNCISKLMWHLYIDKIKSCLGWGGKT